MKNSENAIRAELIKKGIIRPGTIGTKDVECIQCGEIFQVLVDRFDSICGHCEFHKYKPLSHKR